MKAAKEDKAVEFTAIDYNKANEVPYPYGFNDSVVVISLIGSEHKRSATARERQLIHWNFALSWESERGRQI